MSSKEKAIECKVNSSNDFVIKKGKSKEFMDKFAEGLKEICESDEFINDVLDSFVCDVDCVKERE